jgi:hypothetical protein
MQECPFAAFNFNFPGAFASIALPLPVYTELVLVLRSAAAPL